MKQQKVRVTEQRTVDVQMSRTVGASNLHTRLTLGTQGMVTQISNICLVSMWLWSHGQKEAKIATDPFPLFP